MNCPRCNCKMTNHEDVYGLYMECEQCGYLISEKDVSKNWAKIRQCKKI